jgi:hypothetical protein
MFLTSNLVHILRYMASITECIASCVTVSSKILLLKHLETSNKDFLTLTLIWIGVMTPFTTFVDDPTGNLKTRIFFAILTKKIYLGTVASPLAVGTDMVHYQVLRVLAAARTGVAVAGIVASGVAVAGIAVDQTVAGIAVDQTVAVFAVVAVVVSAPVAA